MYLTYDQGTDQTHFNVLLFLRFNRRFIIPRDTWNNTHRVYLIAIIRAAEVEITRHE